MTVFPTGWQLEPVKNIGREGEFFDGDWVESKDQDPTGQVRLVQLADVGEGNFRDKSSRWLRDDQADRLGASYLEAGDLLIARMPDPMGRCCQMPKLPYRSITAVDVAVLRIGRADISPKFVMWALNSPGIRNSITSLASGTTRQRVSRKNLGAVEVPVPPLGEQERIVEILEEQFSRLDDALASIRTVRGKAKAFRTSLLQAAFSGSLSNESVKFEPVPLQDLVDAKADITDGPFGSNLKSEHYTTSGPRVVRLANISSGGFINSFVHISAEHFATLQKHRVLAGDVLVATLGESIPRACIAPEYLGDAIVKADCIRIRPSRRVNSSFLSYAINSPVVRASATSMIQGVTRPRINLGTLRTTVIPLPPLAEQCRIAELIEEQFSRLDDALEITNRLELRIASERRSILHAAFSGTLTAQWRETHHG